MILRNICFLATYILLVACSAQNLKSKANVNCNRFNIRTDTNYSGGSEATKSIMLDFNSINNKTLDIVRIISESDYDHSERLKRVYIENNRIYVYKDNVLEIKDEKLEEINNLFKSIKNDSILINCEASSSLQTTYRYFLKLDGNLIFTFFSNRLPENIDRNMIKEEYNYIDYFEKL